MLAARLRVGVEQAADHYDGHQPAAIGSARPDWMDRSAASHRVTVTVACFRRDSGSDFTPDYGGEVLQLGAELLQLELRSSFSEQTRFSMRSISPSGKLTPRRSRPLPSPTCGARPRRGISGAPVPA